VSINGVPWHVQKKIPILKKIVGDKKNFPKFVGKTHYYSA
jgi:hypothetical protein